MTDPVTELQTALGERYTIVRELGRGGMAVVYLAEDAKLERQVAIKVLRPDLAATLGAERFLREIAITSQLNHPNILPLLDSGEANGSLYYVMPYIEGETLGERLQRERQLPFDEAIRITTQVADALGHAHARDIIHRDVKPDNIMLTEGKALVADFGIARAVTEAGGERLTETGITVGTPAYMSPEQAMGERTIDTRTDIYAVGCVLYEMLGGEPPFTGTTAQAILARKVTDAVPSLRAARDGLPETLELVVMKALAKTPADRFTTAEQLSTALTDPTLKTMRLPTVAQVRRRRAKRLALVGTAAVAIVLLAVWRFGFSGSAAPTLDPRLIAVPPFKFTATDTTVDYLQGAGMLEILSTVLTGDALPRAVSTPTMLAAWSRSGAADRELTVDEHIALAAQLGAAQLLLGEAVWTGTELLLNGRLVDVATGESSPAEALAGSRDEVFALSAQLVARLFALQVGEDQTRLSTLSQSLEANVAYLQGRLAFLDGRRGDALGHFSRAVEADSGFALAYMAMGQAATGSRNWASQRAWVLRDRLSQQDRAYLRGEEWVGPNYPQPWTFVELFAAQDSAIRAAPDRADFWHRYGWMLEAFGNYANVPDWLERAAAILDTAVALDPAHVPAHRDRLKAYIRLGDRDAIRRVADSTFAAMGDEQAHVGKWWVATVLNDSAALTRERARFGDVASPYDMTTISAYEGLPLDDALTGARARETNSLLPPWLRAHIGWARAVIAMLQGRARDAVALADTFVPYAAAVNATTVIELAIMEPGAGYDSAAAEWAAVFDDGQSGRDACYSTLWRVSRGDTSGARVAIERITSLTREWDASPIGGMGPFGVCTSVIATMLEWRDGFPESTPALDHLDSLMRDGPGYEPPHILANYVIANLRNRQGRHAVALAAARRLPSAPSIPLIPAAAAPAYLFEEGRAALALGDTAAAITAYSKFLNLRSDPDPGPIRDQVEFVRGELARLIGERGNR